MLLELWRRRRSSIGRAGFGRRRRAGKRIDWGYGFGVLQGRTAADSGVVRPIVHGRQSRERGANGRGAVCSLKLLREMRRLPRGGFECSPDGGVLVGVVVYGSRGETSVVAASSSRAGVALCATCKDV